MEADKRIAATENAHDRRLLAMQSIDRRIKEYNKQYGPKIAEKCKNDIIDDVAMDTFYNPKTLRRYYNDYLKKRGYFHKPEKVNAV